MHLTPREEQTLEIVARIQSEGEDVRNKDVSAALRVSMVTSQFYLRSLCNKGCLNRIGRLYYQLTRRGKGVLSFK